MYRPITMYQIVCDRCGEVFGGTDYEAYNERIAKINKKEG